MIKTLKELKKININILTPELLEKHIDVILTLEDKPLKEYIVFMLFELQKTEETTENETLFVLDKKLKPYFKTLEYFINEEANIDEDLFEEAFVEKYINDEKILAEKKKIIYQKDGITMMKF